ncbi:hypothetical protein Vi05172_g1252 [Venturia inaequalis]|nr:hypothetical protein Vi05172_g1252 [Venturia inaequalis]
MIVGSRSINLYQFGAAGGVFSSAPSLYANLLSWGGIRPLESIDCLKNILLSVKYFESKSLLVVELKVRDMIRRAGWSCDIVNSFDNIKF